MRTTSGSESQNAMFGNLTAPILSLVEFWVRFVHALESQQYRESKVENASVISLPKMKTPLDIENIGGSCTHILTSTSFATSYVMHCLIVRY